MQHDAFIGQVQARARLDSRGSAEAAARATLETLAERIPANLANDLAAQLPKEINEHVLRITASGEAEHAARFDQDEFVARVADRARTDTPKAAHLARVVFEVLDEATTGGTMAKIRESLPEDLRQLAVAGSTG